MPDIVEWATRFWTDLLDRPSGPMAFRFILQPTMATIFAIRDGIKDARTGRTPFFWNLVKDPSHRKASLQEAVRATLRIIVLGLTMDLIYQWTVFRSFRPLEAVVVTFLIAFLPYPLIRGPAGRIARRLLKSPPAQIADKEVHR